MHYSPTIVFCILLFISGCFGARNHSDSTTGGATRGTGDYCSSSGYRSSHGRLWKLGSLPQLSTVVDKFVYTFSLCGNESAMVCGGDPVLCQIDTRHENLYYDLGGRNSLNDLKDLTDSDFEVTYQGGYCATGAGSKRTTKFTFFCTDTISKITLRENTPCNYAANVYVPLDMCDDKPRCNKVGVVVGTAFGSFAFGVAVTAAVGTLVYYLRRQQLEKYANMEAQKKSQQQAAEREN